MKNELKAKLDKILNVKSLQLYRFACYVIRKLKLVYPKDERIKTGFYAAELGKVHAGNIIAAGAGSKRGNSRTECSGIHDH